MDEERKLEIEQKAKDVLAQYESEQSVIDIVGLVRSYDFVVKPIELDDEEDGFIIVDTRKGDFRLISVNTNRTYEEARFILAHEIGHYIMSESKEKDILFAAREKTHGRSEEENEIDYFAACLLMPKTLFIKKYKEFKKQIGDKENILAVRLADFFKVPVESAKRRMIKELKLFGA